MPWPIKLWPSSHLFQLSPHQLIITPSTSEAADTSTPADTPHQRRHSSPQQCQMQRAMELERSADANYLSPPTPHSKQTRRRRPPPHQRTPPHQRVQHRLNQTPITQVHRLHHASTPASTEAQYVAHPTYQEAIEANGKVNMHIGMPLKEYPGTVLSWGTTAFQWNEKLPN